MDEFRHDEFCFDKLKNIEPPEYFAEKALAIAQTQRQTKKLILTPSVWIASSAAAVLMLLVGLGLLTNVFGNHPDIVKRGELETIAVTDPQGSVISYVPAEKESTHVDRDGSEALGDDNTSDPTATAANTVSAFEHKAKETEPKAAKATELSTAESSASHHTEPGASSDVQTEPLTVPCTETSTEQIETTVTAEEPPEPNTGSHTEPTTDNRYFRGKIGIIFPNGAYSTPVYCTIISSNGSTICYRNNTTVSNEGVYTTAMFAPSRYGYRLRFGSYTAVFYSSTGAVMTQVSFTVVNESSVTYLFPVG